MVLLVLVSSVKAPPSLNVFELKVKPYKICEVCFNYVLNPTVREYCKRPIRINICPNCHTEFGWDNHEYLDE
jgi:hypothetical protein